MKPSEIAKVSEQMSFSLTREQVQIILRDLKIHLGNIAESNHLRTYFCNILEYLSARGQEKEFLESLKKEYPKFLGTGVETTDKEVKFNIDESLRRELANERKERRQLELKFQALLEQVERERKNSHTLQQENKELKILLQRLSSENVSVGKLEQTGNQLEELVDLCMNNYLLQTQTDSALTRLNINPNEIARENNMRDNIRNTLQYLNRIKKLRLWLSILATDGLVFAREYLQRK